MLDGRISQPWQFQPILASDKPGYWSKVDLFEPGRFTGRCLYLDLDTTPVGALDDLADLPFPFVACRDWATLGLNSSVMAWTPSPATERIYTSFSPDVMDRLPGDQDWIARVMLDAMTFPKRWCQSYKADFLRRGWHPDTRVRVYHGRPKLWDIE